MAPFLTISYTRTRTHHDSVVWDERGRPLDDGIVNRRRKQNFALCPTSVRVCTTYICNIRDIVRMYACVQLPSNQHFY